MHAHVCASLCIYVHACAYACACVHINVRVCAVVCVNVGACMCVCMQVCARVYEREMEGHTCARVYTERASERARETGACTAAPTDLCLKRIPDFLVPRDFLFTLFDLVDDFGPIRQMSVSLLPEHVAVPACAWICVCVCVCSSVSVSVTDCVGPCSFSSHFISA